MRPGVLALVVLALAGCGGGQAPPPGPTPAPAGDHGVSAADPFETLEALDARLDALQGDVMAAMGHPDAPPETTLQEWHRRLAAIQAEVDAVRAPDPETTVFRTSLHDRIAQIAAGLPATAD